MKLSARACHRLIKLARTIADLDGRAEIETQDIAEAASYRGLSLRGLGSPHAAPAPSVAPPAR